MQSAIRWSLANGLNLEILVLYIISIRRRWRVELRHAIPRHRLQHALLFAGRTRALYLHVRMPRSQLFDEQREIAADMSALSEKYRNNGNRLGAARNELRRDVCEIGRHDLEECKPHLVSRRRSADA